MVDKDSVENFARDMGGKVQDAVGDATTQLRGRANQAAGAAQELYGQASDEVKAKANFVTASYEDEGFAKALEEHFLTGASK